MVETKWWLTYEMPNGYIKVGEIKRHPVESVRIKILFPDAQNDILLRKEEALAIAYGITKTMFEIEKSKLLSQGFEP